MEDIERRFMKRSPRFAIIADALQDFFRIIHEVGGRYDMQPASSPDDPIKTHEPKHRTVRREIGKNKHYYDHNGSLRRNSPKRDKRMSARQWKKSVKAARRLPFDKDGGVN